MRCQECNTELSRLDNAHLLACCGITLQEYAIKYHQPLDILLNADQLNLDESLADYPEVTSRPDDRALSCLAGLRLAGLLREADGFVIVPGEIRRLDLLLWQLQRLSAFGFRFRQEYFFNDDSHRVFAINRLKARLANVDRWRKISPFDAPDLLDCLAVLVANLAELHAGYIFIPINEPKFSDPLIHRLENQFQIRFESLEPIDSKVGALLRTATEHDATRLLNLLKDRCLEIPAVEERLYSKLPEATIVKELVFDAAHFITDHPGKCSNLHGGRYVMKVKVKDRIDPATGFVLDYSYLKAVVKHRVVSKLDHKNLNYSGAELAWRSSTELLCIHIWEQLIDYLPGLQELEIHETAQSYCCYSGPGLSAFQDQGSSQLLRHFTNPELGKSSLRS